MTAWLRLHWMAFGATLSKLASTPFATILNVLVIGVALALPAGAYSLLFNLQAAARNVSSDPEFSVFLSLEVQKNEITELDRRLKGLAGVAKVEFRSRESALAEFRVGPSEIQSSRNLVSSFILRYE